MKKIFLITAAIVMTFLLCSCLPKNRSSSAKLKIVVSTPVLYDWTRVIIDQNYNEKLSLSLIMKNGLQYHEYTPSSPEVSSIKNAELFIFMGGKTEQWTRELGFPEQSENPIRKTLCLMDYAEASDEHFFLSPLTASLCCQKICEEVCLLDPANSALYKKNYDSYKAQLELLETTIKLTAKKAVNTTFIICDRFPYKFIFDDYGINYICKYPQCPATQKPDTETLKWLGSKIDEYAAGEIYVSETAEKQLSKKIIGYSKNPKCDTIVLDSMESLTLSQLFSGKNYLDISRNNLTSLRLN